MAVSDGISVATANPYDCNFYYIILKTTINTRRYSFYPCRSYEYSFAPNNRTHPNAINPNKNPEPIVTNLTKIVIATATANP